LQSKTEARNVQAKAASDELNRVRPPHSYDALNRLTCTSEGERGARPTAMTTSATGLSGLES